MGTKRKLFCWLLFAAAEIIVLAVAAGYFYVLDHGPLHLALTVIFLLCHIALCALARGKCSVCCSGDTGRLPCF